MTYSAAVLMLKVAGIPSVKYYVMSLTGFFLLDLPQTIRLTVNVNVNVCVILIITVMRKRKAILWKRWNVSNAPQDKALYKTVAGNCKNAIDKFHAAKELALVRKNNLGSFFSFINNRLKSYVTSACLKWMMEL